MNKKEQKHLMLLTPELEKYISKKQKKLNKDDIEKAKRKNEMKNVFKKSNNMENKLLKIINYYGVNNQLKKLNEENFELIEAIINSNKFRNFLITDDLDNIKEEIADNLVLLSQFILYFGIELDEIEGIFNKKVNRQLERIKNE